MAGLADFGFFFFGFFLLFDEVDDDEGRSMMNKNVTYQVLLRATADLRMV